MNRDIIITCAVTGAGDTVGMHPRVNSSSIWSTAMTRRASNGVSTVEDIDALQREAEPRRSPAGTSPPAATASDSHATVPAPGSSP